MNVADFIVLPLAWSWPWEWSWELIWNLVQQLVIGIVDWLADLFVWALNQVPTPPQANWTGWEEYLAWANGFVPGETIKWLLVFYLGWWLAWSTFRIIAKLIWSG